MKRIIVELLFAFLLSAFFNTEAQAKIINAASCNAGDVQNALNQAANGDTVAIPAGTCTWTTQVSWTAPANVVLRGAGSESVVGGGDATVIIDDLDRTSSDNGVLNVTMNPSGVFRMAALT